MSFQAAIQETTPMMAQYLSVKREHEDCLLLYRMGDFYEMFFDDAVRGARALDIALTQRGKHNGENIPMCGVPVAALDGYLSKLVRFGFKVAICEQVESPEDAKKRGYKEIVRRDVVRIVTPGTITEESLLDARKNNFLVAVSQIKDIFSVAAIDISTGEFTTETVKKYEITSVLSKYNPKEILCSLTLFNTGAIPIKPWVVTPLPDPKFRPMIERERLEKFFGVCDVSVFGKFSSGEIACCGALVEYLSITQKDNLPKLVPPKSVDNSLYVLVDASTRENLEIFKSTKGDYKNSLLSVLDETCTPIGGRLLSKRLSAPLRCVNSIKDRLDSIEFFMQNKELCNSLRKILSSCPDFERALGRIRFLRGSPRDLGIIRSAFRTLEQIKHLLAVFSFFPGELSYQIRNLGDQDALKILLEKALIEDLPIYAKDGDFIACGYNDELDQLKQARDNSRQLIENLQQHYITETNINSLKVRFNNILGWYVEVPPSQVQKIPESFIHKQSLTTSVRYVTSELQEIQDRLINAADRALKLEQSIFNEIVENVLSRIEDLQFAANSIAVIDLCCSCAFLSSERKYVKPIVDDCNKLEISQGRHPIVEERDNESLQNGFIPNDCSLSNISRISLLTGPNMAGKSTYLRQNALIILMAQCGFFVPAESAHIGVVDKLFSRIGAADDLANGRSTFMVEMLETSSILHQATDKSFVILDEVGRGTSTFDGVSIAWAVLEHMHNSIKCRGLFATHYHELIKLKQTSMKFQTLKVQEWKGKVVFHHQVIEGSADKSYGIYVASLAGFPQTVVSRAQEVLKNLEERKIQVDLPFVTNQTKITEIDDTFIKIKNCLEQTDINNLTPFDALSLVYDLKKLAQKAK